MNYDGGKNGSGVYQRLICMMPPHRLYVEAFAGSAAILRRKRPADKSIAYELNRATIWELAKHIPADRFQPWGVNSEWASPADPLPACGGTSIGFDRPQPDPADQTYTQNLEIFNLDAFEMLAAKFVAGSVIYGFYDPGEILIYLDPPYPDSVRSTKGKIYQHEMLSDLEHAEICDLVLSIPARVMLSGYENDLYNQKLKGWRKETIPTTNRAGKRTTETVWLNFPPPAELHDATHVGNNFRERWNITKRVRNWTGQLQAMPAGTRQAVFESLRDEVDKFLDDARAVDAAFMDKLARRAAAANKRRRPLTPKPALTAIAEVPLFED
jgi:DNA adenine methylase